MKTRVIMLLTFCLGALFLWSAGRRNAELLEARSTYQLGAAQPLENAPPLVVFSTVALGGFSGIIADALWIRAAKLQMDGKYFELVQLAEWITRLEPRFTEGWVYHAWNLAYNVSVMFKRPEDRWRWVRHGLELLRDGALRYNPEDPVLYRELGWIFQHKIGQSMDQAHHFYKFAWANEMGRLFDGPRPDYAAWAALPQSRSEALHRADFRELIQALLDADLDPFTLPTQDPAKLDAFMAIVTAHSAGADFMAYTRLRRMTEEYRMDPVMMQQVEAEVGPMDWRLPQAHSIYWAWRGLKYAEGYERLFLERMIFQNMADAFRQGRYFYDPVEDIFIPSPLPDLYPFVRRAFLKALNEHPDDSSMQTAYFNFLTHALTVFYTYHRTSDAQAIFQEIQERYPSDATRRGFESFVVETFTERVEDLSDFDAQALVQGSFYQSFFWLALGDPERAAGYDRLARACWQAYMAPRMDDKEFRQRTGLAPLNQLRRIALDQVRQAMASQGARDRLRNAE